MEETYYIPGSPFGVIGYKVKCRTCGRGVVVECVLNGTNHNISVGVTCLECVKLTEESRERLPEVSKTLDRWVAENAVVAELVDAQA